VSVTTPTQNAPAVPHDDSSAVFTAAEAGDRAKPSAAKANAAAPAVMRLFMELLSQALSGYQGLSEARKATNNLRSPYPN